MRIKIFLLGCLLSLATTSSYASLYSINGHDMLSSGATYEQGPGVNEINNAIDGIDDSNGWLSTTISSPSDEYYFIKFDNGMTSVGQMQILN